MLRKTDVLIVGGGIMGMAMARKLKELQPHRQIDLIEKEFDVGQHASSRNSGVLHAGFYYSADSLKARLTATGNSRLRDFCAEKGIPINDCGKLVVARNDQEAERLVELERRGKVNGSVVNLISEAEAQKFDPNVKTHRHALYSPRTGTVDPATVCAAMRDDILKKGVRLHLATRYLKRVQDNRVATSIGEFQPELLINCAGLYADKIAREFGKSQKYTIVPFRGRYLEYKGDSSALRTNVYPVPDLRNPFLGVHFTKKTDGTLKIGPTATPSLWREHYGGFERFKFGEFLEIAWIQSRMFWSNSHSFRQLAWEEIKKYNRGYLIRSALELLRGGVEASGFGKYGKSGIRAQLVDKETLQLVQDFVVERDRESLHVLNAVSPGFTCSLAFADYVIQEHGL
jgi:L-2-hydroxyglutarate oxidase